MGSNEVDLYTKKFIHVKVKSPNVNRLNELKNLLNQAQRVAFAGVYGKILELATINVPVDAIAALAQYYDDPLRCFTFRNFQLAPTLEEFEKILGCPIGDREPYLFSGHYASLAKLAEVIGIPQPDLAKRQQNRNGVKGIPCEMLAKKAKEVAEKQEWTLFRDILALMIYGVVLFPNVEGLIDSASIDAFLAYRARKASPVVAVLADVHLTFSLSCEKEGVRILCCLPALYVWLVCHVLTHGGRPTCPIEDFRMTSGRDKINWWNHLASMSGGTIRWFPRWKEVPNVLCQCGKYPNVPLMGTRGGINYNPMLIIRQLGYPFRGPPVDSALEPFVFRGFGPANAGSIASIRKAWGNVVRKNLELRKRDATVVGTYNQWLEDRVRQVKLPRRRCNHSEPIEEPVEESEEVKKLKAELEKAESMKEKLKGVVIRVRKECNRLKDVNMSTAEALEQETRRAEAEERSRKRYQGALSGNNNELKLRRVERDKAIDENATLRDELKSCWESKEDLKEQRDMTEKNMLAIIEQYEKKIVDERQNLAITHGQALKEEQAKVLALQAEAEMREEAMGLLHQEGMKWMDRFALTMNECQELPKVLAQAKAMADVRSVPTEVHNLFDYCQHMIDLMTYIIRNR